MTKEPNQAKGGPPDKEDSPKGYKNYLEFLKQSKSSSISMWMGKASDLYKDVDQYVKDEATSDTRAGVVCDPSFVRQGALKKAVEIARTDFVKVKLEADDPIELSQKFSARLARLNDEYHHKQLLYPMMEIIGFMKDKDSKQDRLLVVANGENADKVLAIDPQTGAVADTFVISTRHAAIALSRID